MASALKKLIPFKWKAYTLIVLNKLKPLQDLGYNIPSEKKQRIFIFLAADYGNLGDVAITYAQHKFLSHAFPNAIVTEIPISETLKGIVFVKKIIRKGDIVTTVGGGNMGDLYESIEFFRQLVIKNFKNNKLVAFPQTIDFNHNKKGMAALNKAIKIYSSHPDLTLIAREHKSYDYFRNHFKNNNILLTPDIVLSQNQAKPEYPRKGAIICLRNDKEKKLSISEEETLSKILEHQFKSVTLRDTHVGGSGLPLLNRVKKLKHIWEDFKKAEIVITDRLHGMIFCYITGTPALIFLNNNHKIKSSYFWINDATYIQLMEDFNPDKVKEAISKLKTIKSEPNSQNLIPKYTAIIDAIKH